MPTVLSRDWTYQGFEIVRLENPAMIADVIPRLGGKIVHLIDKRTHRKFLWHNPRQRLRELPVGAGYDDHFFGGWDELLPNDLPEVIGGEPWADHGELWTCPLDVETAGPALMLNGLLPINPLAYERRMWLDEEAPILHMRAKVTNIGRISIEFLWKLHPALRISPGCTYDIPARRAIIVDRDFSRLGHLEEFPWPNATDAEGKPARADRVDAIDGTSEFLYLVDLAEGRCALANEAEDWRFTMTFPRSVFPTVWIFASYGGWRNHEVAILEPCTTWPKALTSAIALDRAHHLEPGESMSADITVRLGRYREEPA